MGAADERHPGTGRRNDLAGADLRIMITGGEDRDVLTAVIKAFSRFFRLDPSNDPCGVAADDGIRRHVLRHHRASGDQTV